MEKVASARTWTPTCGAPSSRHKSDALGVFTFLWSHVMVLQVVKLSVPLIGASIGSLMLEQVVWPALMAFACLLGCVCPHSLAATACLTTTSIVVLWVTGSQSNHVFMDMAVCFAVLLTFSRDRALWQARATHAVRAFLITLYYITALHKMNKDWSNPQYSCCTLMLSGVLAMAPLRGLLPFVPIHSAPFFATLTELVLPSFLLLGRCHRFVTFLGVSFHMVICQMLSPMSVYPFSVLMLPLYAFVLPGRVAVAFHHLRPAAWFLVPAYAVTTRLWTGFVVSGGLSAGEELFEYPPYGLWAPGIVWCNFVTVFLIWAAMRPLTCDELTIENSLPRPVSSWCGRLPALVVVFFGLTPYLGIRTYPALAMFSNLRTEGGKSNHLFLRDDFDFLGIQRDFVTVHDTNIRSIRIMQVDLAPLFSSGTKETLAAAGVEQQFWITPPTKAWPYPETREFRPYSMPFVELRRRIALLSATTNATGFVRYTRTVIRPNLVWPHLRQLLVGEADDRTWTADNLMYRLEEGGDSELEKPLPQWLDMVLRFRTFDTDYSPCRH
eukprot:TRINITY_DN35187_c0_g1_i1.p1 TRINITY_DN35187_c0_g1~~TRINITY_DN35187_c0_g1_i1.p1  ORF type:complete len:568 (-),score=54.11 TRINITY_DN35187_c0_g1_i1:61-1716(-)